MDLEKADNVARSPVSRKRVLGIAVVAAALLIVSVVACESQRTDRPGETATPPENDVPTTRSAEPFSGIDTPGASLNRIAYVGNDGNLFTVNPDGTDVSKLTNTDLRVGPAGPVLGQTAQTQLFYAWPTWSPDSSKIAASLVAVSGNDARLSVEVIDVADGGSTRVYTNQPNTPSIARGAPHYLYWTPDSAKITFLAAEPTVLTLFAAAADGSVPATGVLSGSPLYFSFSTEGEAVVFHLGEELLKSTYVQGEFGVPENIGSAGYGFKTPAVSPDGSRFAYAAQDMASGSQALFVGNLENPSNEARAVADLGPSSALVWSPAGTHVAAAESLATTSQIYDRMVLVTGDGANSRIAVSEPFLSFFWSPTGDKIVYVAFDQIAQTFTWKYLDVAGGEPVKMIEFVPSVDFLTLLTFFDQYALSNSVWSPDGTQILFSGTTDAGGVRRNGSSPNVDHVYVIDVKEGSVPREIAASPLAVWSWR